MASEAGSKRRSTAIVPAWWWRCGVFGKAGKARALHDRGVRTLPIKLMLHHAERIKVGTVYIVIEITVRSARIAHCSFSHPIFTVEKSEMTSLQCL